MLELLYAHRGCRFDHQEPQTTTATARNHLTVGVSNLKQLPQTHVLRTRIPVGGAILGGPGMFSEAWLEKMGHQGQAFSVLYTSGSDLLSSLPCTQS